VISTGSFADLQTGRRGTSGEVCVHAHSSSSMFATAAAELKYSCKMRKGSENTHSKKSNKRKNKTTFLSSVFHKKQKR